MQDAHLAGILEEKLAPFTDRVSAVLSENDRLREENEALKRQIASSKPERKQPTPEVSDSYIDSILQRGGVSGAQSRVVGQPLTQPPLDTKIERLLDSVLNK